MAENPALTLSSFLDGETVNAGDVLAALDTDEGRHALADFVRLRVVLSQDDTAPGPGFYAKARAIAPAVRPVPNRRTAWTLTLAVAASLVGFASGATVMWRMAAEPSAPPSAARVLVFQPGVDWQQTPPPVEHAK